jgi:hypothetical protein
MTRLSLLLLAVLIFGACSRNGPPSLTMEEVPAALIKAFQTARMQVKKNGESVAQLIRNKQYVAASIQLQALLSNPDLSKEQRDVASSALLTVNETLQSQAAVTQPTTAAEDGNATPKPPAQAVSPDDAKAAAAALEHYRATK